MLKERINPYQRNNVWWARIPQVDAHAIPHSLDVRDKQVATLICAFLVWARGRGERWALAQMASGELSILAAYHAYVENRWDKFLIEQKDGIADKDVFPFVQMWQQEMARIGTPQEVSRKKYLAHVTTLIDGPFPSSKLTKQTIREWLSDKGKSANKYRASLSSFCGYLVEMDVLKHNPVGDVKAARAQPPRDRYLEQPDVLRVLNALSGQARAYHALAACTALETQALVRLRRSDIDVTKRTVFARATKNAGRSRTTTVYKRWFWAWEMVLAHLDANPMLPEAPVFTIKADQAYRELLAACGAIGIENFRVHDWRHVWAVQAIRDGLNIQTVSHQLGHKNPTQTLNVYGKFIPTATDYEQNSTPNHTATTQAIGGNGGN